MTHSALNHGTIGRCACGDIGKRRDRYGGEPICAKCMPERAGILRCVDPVRDLMAGSLTPAQRRARREFLRTTKQEEAFRANEEAMRGRREHVDSDGDGRHL